jgi:ferredoxin
MKVTIDRNECVSCGTCWETCPAFFEQNPDDSFSQVMAKFRSTQSSSEGISPQELDACVAEAAGLCPVQIIHVEE